MEASPSEYRPELHKLKAMKPLGEALPLLRKAAGNLIDACTCCHESTPEFKQAFLWKCEVQTLQIRLEDLLVAMEKKML